MTRARVQHYIRCFQELTPDNLPSLLACFSERARFVDPFNDVRGRAAIQGVFEHMFAGCDEPRFTVDECIGENRIFYLRWRFTFGKEPASRALDGVSRVQFGSDGLVDEHLDYWDPASQLYERIPVLGVVLRALRRRLAAPRTTHRLVGNRERAPAATHR